MTELSKRTRAAAAARNMTIAELERRAGVANGTISKWDTSSPSYDKVVKVADVLELSLDFLCGRKPRKEGG